MSRMYILVRQSTPRGWAVNGVGHVALMCYLKFKKHPDTKWWLKNSFRKVTCLVSDEEFKLAKRAGDYVVFKEDDLDDMPLTMAFKPRHKYPCYFNGFKLFS